MIDLPLLFAFIAAAAILTITPGVDTAMVLRSAAIDGPRSGIAAGTGILIGCMIWGAAISLGLGALLQASELAYTIVKWIGAAYLVWIGVTLLLHPRESLGAEDGTAQSSGFTALRRGFLTNMLNPKVGIFYVTFLPQFIPQGANVAAYAFLLAAIHIALTILWFAGLIAATVPLGRLLRAPRIVKSLDRLTGGVFLAFGIKLATSTASR